MHDHAVSALVRRRRELTGEIDALLSRIAAITDDVRALDQVMLLFRPDMRPEAIPSVAYRPKADWAQRGEVQRAVLNIMREAGEPLECAAITKAVMTARGTDPNAYPLHRKRVSRTLDKLRTRGLATMARDGGRLLWRLAR